MAIKRTAFDKIFEENKKRQTDRNSKINMLKAEKAKAEDNVNRSHKDFDIACDELSPSELVTAKKNEKEAEETLEMFTTALDVAEAKTAFTIEEAEAKEAELMKEINEVNLEASRRVVKLLLQAEEIIKANDKEREAYKTLICELDPSKPDYFTINAHSVCANVAKCIYHERMFNPDLF